MNLPLIASKNQTNKKLKNYTTNTVVIHAFILRVQINHVFVLFLDLKEKKL